MKKVTKSIALLLVCLMLFTAVACGGGGNSGGGSSGGEAVSTKRDTLNIAVTSDTGTLNREAATGGLVPAMYCFMEPLFDKTADGEIIYILAESVEVLTPTHWRIHLRKDVTFSNGNPFTASDVLFTFKLYRASVLNNAMAQEMDLENSKVIDDYTYDMVWENYHNNQWGIVSDGLMYDEESFDAELISQNPIGTGPYKVNEYIINSHLFLERRDDYYGEPPPMKYLNFRVLAEPSQIVNALETGVVDMADVAADDVEYVRDLGNITIVDRYNSNWSQVRFNPTIGTTFHNIEARYAVCHAIDREAILNNVYNGRGVVMNSPINSYCLDYEDRFEFLHEIYTVGYDLDLARQYAESSGLAGQTIRLTTNGLREFVTIAEIIQNQLSEIGVEVIIQNYDAAGYSAVTREPDAWEMTVSRGVNPGLLVAGPLINGIRFSPVYSAPGSWEALGMDVESYMEMSLGGFYEPDDQKRSDINYEIFKISAAAAISYPICDILYASAFADDIDLDTVVWRAHGSIRYRAVDAK